MKKSILKLSRAVTCILMCLVLLTGALPMASAKDRTATRLASLSELEEKYLGDNSLTELQYPGGAMMIAQTSALLSQNGFYAINILRRGGTKGKAMITLKSIDLSASYDDDYRLFLSEKGNDRGIDGEAKLYYCESNVPYIPTVTEKQTVYADTAGDEKERLEASTINDNSTSLMPSSSSTVLTFEDGENIKTVYVKTYKSVKVTDDREFMLTLCDPQNCDISAMTTSLMTIVEKREKPASYLSISDVEADLKESTAYVTVRRTGNLGGYDSFHISTKEKSAKAGVSYETVNEDLKFIPNIKELKVPIKILENAKDGESFDIVISDASKAKINSDTASVSFKGKNEIARTGEETRKYVGSGEFIYKVQKYRQYEFVDLSKFKKSRIIGSSDDSSYSYSGSRYNMSLNHGFSFYNHAMSSVSPDKVDLTGVKDIFICSDNKSGSCAYDYTAVKFADSDPLLDNDGSCKWMNSVGDAGVKWSMVNISDYHRIEHINLNDSLRKTKKYLYLAVNKGPFWGGCGVDFHDYDGNADCSFRLNLQPYTVSMIDPDPIDIYINGELKSTKVISEAQFTDPNSQDAKYTTSATFYRYDTTAFKTTVDSKYGIPMLKGIYFCKPSNTKDHSSLLPLSSPSFEFSTEYILNYSEFFETKSGNTSVVIQPVYEFAPVDYTVESYTEEENKVQFNADSKNARGTFTVDGKNIGSLSWTKSERENGKYYDGDTLIYKFTPGSALNDYSVVYETRKAATREDLKKARKETIDAGKDEVSLSVENSAMSVTPILKVNSIKTNLIVTNPDIGDFTSKNSKYQFENPDGSVTITGIKTENADIDFSAYRSGNFFSLFAKPKAGYIAQWTYTDAVSHDKKTYVGDQLYYAVQNPFNPADNTITLTFIQPENSTMTTVSGTVSGYKSTIRHPSTHQTSALMPLKNAVLYMDNCIANTNESGSFTLTDPNDSNMQVKIRCTSDESGDVHSAMLFYNSNYYPCDVKVKRDEKIDITVNAQSISGVIPDSITASSPTAGTYGDTITMVNENPVLFDLTFTADNIDKSKPVNLAVWTFESSSGMVRDTKRTEIKEGSRNARMSCIPAEKAKHGDRMFVEFLYKGYNEKSDPVYHSYGKFETGYTFVMPNIEKVITYMPNIGIYDEKNTSDTASTGYQEVPSVPAIGPISPLISLAGFLPIYSDTSTGKKDKRTNRDIMCLTIGIQFSIARAQAGGNDPKWGTYSIMQQAEKLAKVLDKYADSANPTQMLQTSTKISLAFAFTYQLNYYLNDAGNRCYVSNAYAIGATIGVHFTIPFVIMYIPCFTYIDISCNNVGYLIGTANETKATCGYLTADQLNNSDYWNYHGAFSQDFKIGFGLGLGFDGLLNVGGNLDFGLHSKIDGCSKGKMVFDLRGGIFATFVYLKVAKTFNITKKTLIDTENDPAAAGDIAYDILNEQADEWMKNLTIGDLVIEESDDDPSVNEEGLRAIAQSENSIRTEIFSQSNTAIVKPVVQKIDDTHYLIATVLNDSLNKNRMHMYVYDSDSNKIEEIKKDALGINGYPQEIIDNLNMIDNISIVDCKDDIIVMWSACSMDNIEDLTNSDILKSMHLYGIIMDKKTMNITDDFEIEPEKDHLITTPKAAYNKNTDMLQIFYQSTDLSDITDNTTLESVSNKPISLYTSGCILNDEGLSLGKPVRICENIKSVTEYDVTNYRDSILLTYIGGESSRRTVDPLPEEYKYIEKAEEYGTKNEMYLVRFTKTQDGSIDQSNHLLIADKNNVTVTPVFHHLKAGDTENLLLFFKCNGKYGYQNIDTIYTSAFLNETNTILHKSVMTPTYITTENDFAVNNDFHVYSDEKGNMFGLWTTTQGAEQQIWGKHFTFDSIEKISKVPMIDHNYNVMYDENGNVIMRDIDEPVNLIKGTWGAKTKLTKNDPEENTSRGMFKKNFDCGVLNTGELFCAYNSYDQSYETDTIKTFNNRLVFSRFKLLELFTDDEDFSSIEFSNDYPSAGDTVKITLTNTNRGFMTADNVNVGLLVNGEKYDEKTIDYWFADEKKEISFVYTLPNNVKAEDISIGYEITKNNDLLLRSEEVPFKSGPNLMINMASAAPVKLITDDSNTAVYSVIAEIYNIGNEDYNGGDDIGFINSDLAEQADVLSGKNDEALFTYYGGTTIPEISAGSKTEVTFTSDEIPSYVFDKYGTGSANLELAITPKDGIGWKEITGDDKYGFLDEFGIGQSVKPVPKKIESIHIDDMNVNVGTSAPILTLITPFEATYYSDISYSSSDSCVTIDDNGYVIGKAAGEAVITARSGDVETTFMVKVDRPGKGDTDLDEKITIIDTVEIQKHLAEIKKLTGEAFDQGDLYSKNSVDIKNNTVIQLYLAGKKEILY